MPTSERYLLDTNVWLYAFIRTQDKGKNKIACELIRDSTTLISTQVINEVCVNLISKTNMSESDIKDLIVSFYDRYSIVEINRSIMLLSSQIREKYRISFWDSQLVASAIYSSCSILYTEDMQNGQIIENSLKIVNPFV
jgi:predicted nucleic acid-binding protein